MFSLGNMGAQFTGDSMLPGDSYFLDVFQKHVGLILF